MDTHKYTYKGIQFRKDNEDAELLQRLDAIAKGNDRSFTYTVKELLWKAINTQI